MSRQSVLVAVNGKKYQDFTRLYIRVSLDEICHYVEMEVSEQGRRELSKHDVIEVRYSLDGFERLVTVVKVDSISRVLNSSSKRYQVTARSAARNIVDSSYSEQFSNLTLYQVLEQIAGKFGISTANYAGETERIESFEFEAQSPWQKLQTAAMSQGCVLHSSQVGGLYLSRVSGTGRKEGFQLVQNQNMEEISINENGAEQFYRYEVVGECGEASAVDNSCKDKSRVLTLNMSDSSMSLQDLRRWALVQMRRRRSNTIKVRMTGWGLDKQQLSAVKQLAQREYQGNAYKGLSEEKKAKLHGFETLWQVNMYVPIRSAAYGLGLEAPEYKLVSEVEYTVEAEAISCNVSLKPREDYLGQ